ncbi:GGDEF domain-containing protein [Litoribrevibacter euphylliae]|uniref:diguanylate cyclase n=1 Tax=Litoribrevibacter euphylliae TaxID=1834034 RepID=A0ABV7HFV9_9GAMM
MNTLLNRIGEFAISKFHFRLCLLMLAGFTPVSTILYLDKVYWVAGLSSLVVSYCLIVVFYHCDYFERQCHQLASEVIKDPLTGAFNRRFLIEKLNECLSIFRRTFEVTSVISIDIDHFKSINDQHGHDVGDEVLRQLVRNIKGRIRHTDRLCRVGGEEFILVLPATNKFQSRVVAESLRERLKHSEFPNGMKVTVSMGISEIVAGDDIDSLTKRSDVALYEAKRAGRDQVISC